MNVLLTNHFPLEGSGSGIYTLNMAKMLKRKGFDVTVITPDVERIDPESYEFDVRQILFRRDKRQSDFDLNFNFPCFTTHPKSTNTFYDLTPEQRQAYLDAFRTLIEEVIAEKNIQVFHGQHLWLLTYLGLDVGLKGIATCHGTDLMGYKKDPSYRQYVDQLLDKVGYVIAVSKQTRGQMLEMLPINEDKIITILNGFDPDIFKPQHVSKQEVFARFDLPETEFLISFTGKLAHFKGVDVLLRAAKEYESKIDVTTVIMGDGELRDSLMTLKEELGLKHVHFLGHQDQPDMAWVTAAADVAVTPSRKEPFGLVAIEALACETPVVVSDDGGLKEFIDESVGQVFKSEDHHDLAEKILFEIHNNAKQVKGVHAAQYALENFSWYSVVDQVIELYRRVAA